MTTGKILLKFLIFSAWLSLAFGQCELEKLTEEVKSQENTIKALEKQNRDIANHISLCHTPSTCSMLQKQCPLSTNGMYYFNHRPCKPLDSSPLPQVYCDMTAKNGVGMTVIGHDSEARTLVKGFELPGQYGRKIKYNIPLEQVVAIIKKSKHCEQFIKYECFNSLFWSLIGNIQYSWWVSRQGSKMNYWGGAAVDSGKCACGMTNNCTGGENCNCDKNDLNWREDSGYLTDKNTLPVTELRFGDTGDTQNPYKEAGYHTLGKLRCWG